MLRASRFMFRSIFCPKYGAIPCQWPWVGEGMNGQLSLPLYSPSVSPSFTQARPPTVELRAKRSEVVIDLAARSIRFERLTTDRRDRLQPLRPAKAVKGVPGQ